MVTGDATSVSSVEQGHCVCAHYGTTYSTDYSTNFNTIYNQKLQVLIALTHGAARLITTPEMDSGENASTMMFVEVTALSLTHGGTLPSALCLPGKCLTLTCNKDEELTGHANVILFIAIFITVTFSLKGLNNEILQRTQTQDDKKLIRTVLFKTMAQFFILGCPWILGLSINSSIILEIIFVILISQQGTVIFLVHCVLNKEVRQQYRQWLHTCCPCKKATNIKDDQMTEATCPSTNAHSA
ncbi:hypothetical protein SRHO_G00180130 [Serrasalmus rhombeus]